MCCDKNNDDDANTCNYCKTSILQTTLGLKILLAEALWSKQPVWKSNDCSTMKRPMRYNDIHWACLFCLNGISSV